MDGLSIDGPAHKGEGMPISNDAPELKHCACGCGGIVKRPQATYLPGHNSRRAPSKNHKWKRMGTLVKTFHDDSPDVRGCPDN